MKKIFLITLSLVLLGMVPTIVHAQTATPRLIRAAVSVSPATPVATDSGDLTATDSAEATPSARIDQQIQQKSQTDITQTSGEVKSRLAQLLDDNPIPSLNVTNFVQHAIRRAVDQGVPANMIVLVLMFPVVVSLIAASRHVIGLEGFGVYGPAVLAVAFLSTGIVTGTILFGLITISALLGREIFKRFKLQYLPRTALLVWFVTMVILVALLFSPYFVGLLNLASVGIFPILVLILLSENFVGGQVSLNPSRLLRMMFETILLSALTAWIMGLNPIQEFVILHPELTIAFVVILDLLVGKYTGLRVSEYFRFKPILDQEE